MNSIATSSTVELPTETGELVGKALDKARDDSTSNVEFVDDLGPARRESFSARQADAMVSMASGYLSGNAEQSCNSSRNTSDDYLVTIHVDQSALATGNGRSNLPIESVKRLCCDGHAVVIGEDENGEPLNIGRKTRTVPTAIKRPDGRAVPACGYRAVDVIDGYIGKNSVLRTPMKRGYAIINIRVRCKGRDRCADGSTLALSRHD